MPFDPCHVSTTGDDLTGTGSELAPFRTLDRAVADTMPPPSTILMHGGTYIGRVDLTGVGSPDHPVTIRSVTGECAVIESAARDTVHGLVRFRTVPNSDWEPGDVEDEYVSTYPFPPGTDHGAFIALPGNPHLVTYSNPKDFRSATQQWGKLEDGDGLPGDGFEFVDAHKRQKIDGEFVCVPLGFRYPYVYMGPGLLQEENGHLRIRLSPTENQIPGCPDYQGERDPRLVPLAIWTSEPTLTLTNCHNLRLQDITLRFGSRTLRMKGSYDVELDHLRIDAGQYGVQFASDCQRVAMRHCAVDGGLPTWLFRSDIKDGYHYTGLDGSCVANDLAANTAKSLMYGAPDCVDTVIENCEFRNGHDLYLFGTNTVFRRNWISNLNDDALVLDAEDVQNLRVSENAIEQCLTALSFAQEHAVGPVHVYRNLIDLRRPTLGIRPHWDVGSIEALRYGHLFKENGPTGPVDLIHNTCVVTHRREGPASYGHFSGWDHEHGRRSVNNIFVAVNPEPVHDRPITFLPTPPGSALAQGNCYHRDGHHSGPLFRFRRYPDPITGANVPGDTLADVPAVHAHQLGHLEVEAHSLGDDPGFRRFTAGPTPQHPVDLRLDRGSPCRGAAADLPPDLPADTSPGSPDIGCYPADSPPLAVGVDESRVFPPESS